MPKQDPKIIQTDKVFDFHELSGADGKPLRHGLYMHRRRYLNGDYLGDWTFASRNETPDQVVANAVIIVARVGEKVVITNEFRIPLNAREYGFPAGIIEKGTSTDYTGVRELREETGLHATRVYPELTSGLLVSSAGLSDEATRIVFMDAEGEITYDRNEASENIHAELMDFDQVTDLFYNPDLLISDKAWGMMNTWIMMERICFGLTVCVRSVIWENKGATDESFRLELCYDF